MIEIYTKKQDSPDWILLNDMYFNVYTGNEEISEYECKRQVLFHIFWQLIFHKKRQLIFHTYLVFDTHGVIRGLFVN